MKTCANIFVFKMNKFPNSFFIFTMVPFLICSVFFVTVNSAPIHEYANNLVEVEAPQNFAVDEPTSQNEFEIINNPSPSSIGLNRDQYNEDSESQDFPNNPITTPGPSPLKTSLDNFFNSLTHSVRGMLSTGQHGLLRAIGSVDKTVASVQNAWENTTYSMVLEGQKAAAKVYDETPAVNRLLQRVGTVRDNRMLNQINGIINQWRDNRKKWYEMLHGHEYDWHDVMQNAFSTANKHLGVQDLPKIQMGWY